MEHSALHNLVKVTVNGLVWYYKVEESVQYSGLSTQLIILSIGRYIGTRGGRVRGGSVNIKIMLLDSHVGFHQRRDIPT